MAFKLLISGESNSGKTTLTKGMADTLVISHDGKPYPFQNPHSLLTDASEASKITEFVNAKVMGYKDKFGAMPKVIVFDSVSRIFESLYENCNAKYSGFHVYSKLDTQIKEFASLLEDILPSGINVIILSHAIWNGETSKYELVGKGSFNKVGGFLGVVDEAIFVETKNDKRILHFRSTKFPARTLSTELPDSCEVSKFNLLEHLTFLEAQSTAAAEFTI